MTLTAMRPLSGFTNGRDIERFSVDHIFLSISDFNVVFSALYGSVLAPGK